MFIQVWGAFMETKLDVSTARQWVVCSSSGNSALPLLVQFFMGTTCRLFFMAGENAELMVVTVLQNNAL